MNGSQVRLPNRLSHLLRWGVWIALAFFLLILGLCIWNSLNGTTELSPLSLQNLLATSGALDGIFAVCFAVVCWSDIVQWRGTVRYLMLVSAFTAVLMAVNGFWAGYAGIDWSQHYQFFWFAATVGIVLVALLILRRFMLFVFSDTDKHHVHTTMANHSRRAGKLGIALVLITSVGTLWFMQCILGARYIGGSTPVSFVPFPTVSVIAILIFTSRRRPFNRVFRKNQDSGDEFTAAAVSADTSAAVDLFSSGAPPVGKRILGYLPTAVYIGIVVLGVIHTFQPRFDLARATPSYIVYVAAPMLFYVTLFAWGVPALLNTAHVDPDD